MAKIEISDEKELEKIVGGANLNHTYKTLFCCAGMHEAAKYEVEGNLYGVTGKKCPVCGCNTYGVVVFEDGAPFLVQNGYEYLLD